MAGAKTGLIGSHIVNKHQDYWTLIDPFLGSVPNKLCSPVLKLPVVCHSLIKGIVLPQVDILFNVIQCNS
jgi:hypothetical protein